MCDNCNKEKCSENKFPLITSSFMILTESCNMACEYCFVKQHPKHMTLDTAMDAVKFLIRNADMQNDTPSINFFGGEPLIKWDDIIVPITEYIRKEYAKPFQLSMTTNGLLLDEDKLRYMKDNNIEILFSIDGNKKTQDINRPLRNGSSSFDKLKDVIPLVVKYYPNVTFRSTISHLTVENTFEDMKFAVDSGYKNMFFIPNVFHTWTDKEKEILKHQIEMFCDYYIENAREGKLIHFSPLEKMIGKISQINHAILNDKYRDINYTKCGLGANKFASIGTDGTLYGCQEMVSNNDTNDVFTIGNIYKGVDEERRKSLSALFDCKKISGSNCSSCRLNRICDGGCVANNYLMYGDINKMPEMLCYWNQLLLESAIRICNVLGEEENRAFKTHYFMGGGLNE